MHTTRTGALDDLRPALIRGLQPNDDARGKVRDARVASPVQSRIAMRQVVEDTPQPVAVDGET